MTQAQLDRLAHKMAEDSARSALTSFCVDEGGWHNSSDFSSGTSQWVAQAVCYLEARGKLERHPKRHELVKVK